MKIYVLKKTYGTTYKNKIHCQFIVRLNIFRYLYLIKYLFYLYEVKKKKVNMVKSLFTSINLVQAIPSTHITAKVMLFVYFRSHRSKNLF